MVFIKIQGADQTIAMEFSATVQKPLAEKLGVDEKEVLFLCPETFLVHAGQEQTGFQILIEVLWPTTYQGQEKAVVELLHKHLPNLAVHSHIIFCYFEPAHEYTQINHDYPDYLDATNTVQIDETAAGQAAEATEPFMGNAFAELDDFVARHPEMNEEEAEMEYYKQKNTK